MWTVVVGGVAVVWLTQVATVAAWGLVYAGRHAASMRLAANLAVAVKVGTAVTVGLAAGLVPGLWLQARLAFRPLDGESPAPAMYPLLVLGGAAFGVAPIGQSLAAGLAEALSTVVPIGEIDGRVQFALRTPPHVLTSVLAYAIWVAAVTMQAVGVSRCREGLSGATVAAPRMVPARGRGRAAAWSAVATAAAGACAAAYKLQQHVP